MKSRPTQFGVRENTASSRQHAPRLTKVISSNSNHLRRQTLERQLPLPHEELPTAGIEKPRHATSENAATGGETVRECCLLTVHEVASLLQVPVSWVYGRMRKRSTERLPGYRLGKYWRFNEKEVLAWVKSQRGGQHVA